MNIATANLNKLEILIDPYDIDLAYWRQPEGMVIPDDDLRYLYIPDAVEDASIFVLAKEVFDYQRDLAETPDQITKAVMITMGGMLPGILLYDHLVQGREPGMPQIEFGTIEINRYKGPGERLDVPVIVQDVSIPIAHATTLVIDDLTDYGGTMSYVTSLLEHKLPHKLLTLAIYTKPAAQEMRPPTFSFGEVTQDTWIITPRERVETLMKRVPIWKARGASMLECRRRLVTLIGYPPHLADYYLPIAYDLRKVAVPQAARTHMAA